MSLVYRTLHRIPRTRVVHYAALVTKRCQINMKICRAAYGNYKYVALNVLYIFSYRIHQNFALCFGSNSGCAWIGAQLSRIHFIWIWGKKKSYTCKSMQYGDTFVLAVKLWRICLILLYVWLIFELILSITYFIIGMSVNYSFLFWKYES